MLSHKERPSLLDQRIALSNLPPDKIDKLMQRTAYTKLSGIAIAWGRSNEFKNAVNEVVIGDSVSSGVYGRSFRCRVFRIEGVDVDSMEIEKRLASNILAQNVGLKLNLTNPDFIFSVIVSPNAFVIGLMKNVLVGKGFNERRAGKRPFTIPSALQPKLSRCMVNLAVGSVDDKILDPFAGTGSILIEAALMGHIAIGLELKGWICRGALTNLSTYIPSRENIIQADARKAPLRAEFDAVVTDPPYGRSSTIPGKSFTNLINRFLSEVDYLLARDGKIVMAYPRGSGIADMADRSGFNLLESYSVYVHKSLTREIVVLQR
ncbi:MAG: RsmD family RNA methyltransferase [Aigarchaeota archaeon]|nr:RsmD family RNA methyltransferase [Candidatus Pelearchaeum maunauluense]